MVPNRLQVRVLDYYRECQIAKKPCLIMILKPRQKGASTIAEAVVYHHMRTHPGLNGSLMGDIAATSDKVFEMFRRYYESDRYPWGQGEIDKDQNMGDEITLPNGSKWYKETAGSTNAGRGGTVQVAHMDEVAFFQTTVSKDPTTAYLGSFYKDGPMSLGFATSTPNGACYDDQTEILTDAGWKLFKDLAGTEAILTKDQKTSEAYYERRWLPQVHRYRGPMIHFEAQSVNLAVTPNHMMWMARQKGAFRFSRADSVIGKTTDYHFDRAMKWSSWGLSHFTLPAYTHVQGAGFRTRPAREIPMADWLRFLGHWLADGHIDNRHTKKEVILTQVKFQDLFRESMQAVAKALDVPLHEKPHGNGRRFSVHSAQLVEYLKDYCRPKRIPRELLMGLSRAQCRALIEAIYDGDGQQYKRRTSGNCDYGLIYAGVDGALVDDIQELSLKAGYATNAFGPERNRKVTFTESTRAQVKHDNPPTVREGYDGFVYCVTLPKDHLLMVRRKGIAQWCGNSGWFYDTWNGVNSWKKIFAAWFEFEDSVIPFATDEARRKFETSMTEDEINERKIHGVTLEQLQWRRDKIMTDYQGDTAKFRQEYPSDPETCFLLSSRPKFDMAAVKNMIAACGSNDQRQRGNLVIQGEKSAMWLPDPEGSIHRWEEPTIGCRYVISVDTCTGKDQQIGGRASNPDWHDIQVWRAGYIHPGTQEWQRHKLVAWHKSRVDTDLLAEEVASLSFYYGKCLVVPEINGAGGHHVVKILVKYGVPVFRRKPHTNGRPKSADEELEAYGWQTDVITRKEIVDTLVPLVRLEKIEIYATEVLEQFRTFVQGDSKAEAMPGKHDDSVLAAAIALYNIGAATEYRLGKVRGLDLMRLARDPRYMAPDGFRRKLVG